MNISSVCLFIVMKGICTVDRGADMAGMCVCAYFFVIQQLSSILFVIFFVNSLCHMYIIKLQL